MDKNQIKVYKQIFYHLINIAETFPQYSIPQHLVHILRKKEDLKEAYFWTNEKLLSKIEDYHKELVEDLLVTPQEEQN